MNFTGHPYTSQYTRNQSKLTVVGSVKLGLTPNGLRVFHKHIFIFYYIKYLSVGSYKTTT